MHTANLLPSAVKRKIELTEPGGNNAVSSVDSEDQSACKVSFDGVLDERMEVTDSKSLPVFTDEPLKNGSVSKRLLASYCSLVSRASAGSAFSLVGVASVGSVCSVLCLAGAASLLSIGSTASVLSVASTASVLSVASVPYTHLTLPTTAIV